MTPTELYELGCQLGYGWQTWLAGEIPCNPRTLRRLLSGERPIRPIVEKRVREVIAGELERQGETHLKRKL